ncbi:MAG: hypothetical protein ACOC1G_08830, partial [Phycisphaeraceae bacterium]
DRGRSLHRFVINYGTNKKLHFGSPYRDSSGNRIERVRIRDVQRPATIILYGDDMDNPATNGGSFGSIWYKGSFQGAPTKATRHGGGGAFVHVDGHAEGLDASEVYADNPGTPSSQLHEDDRDQWEHFTWGGNANTGEGGW